MPALNKVDKKSAIIHMSSSSPKKKPVVIVYNSKIHNKARGSTKFENASALRKFVQKLLSDATTVDEKLMKRVTVEQLDYLAQKSNLSDKEMQSYAGLNKEARILRLRELLSYDGAVLDIEEEVKRSPERRISIRKFIAKHKLTHKLPEYMRHVEEYIAVSRDVMVDLIEFMMVRKVPIVESQVIEWEKQLITCDSHTFYKVSRMTLERDVKKIAQRILYPKKYKDDKYRCARRAVEIVRGVLKAIDDCKIEVAEFMGPEVGLFKLGEITLGREVCVRGKKIPLENGSKLVRHINIYLGAIYYPYFVQDYLPCDYKPPLDQSATQKQKPAVKFESQKAIKDFATICFILRTADTLNIDKTKLLSIDQTFLKNLQLYNGIQAVPDIKISQGENYTPSPLFKVVLDTFTNRVKNASQSYGFGFLESWLLGYFRMPELEDFLMIDNWKDIRQKCPTDST